MLRMQAHNTIFRDLIVDIELIMLSGLLQRDQHLDSIQENL